MTTTIDNYLKDDIVSFAFEKIETYTNAKGEIKKKLLECLIGNPLIKIIVLIIQMVQLLVLSLVKYLT